MVLTKSQREFEGSRGVRRPGFTTPVIAIALLWAHAHADPAWAEEDGELTQMAVPVQVRIDRLTSDVTVVEIACELYSSFASTDQAIAEGSFLLARAGVGDVLGPDTVFDGNSISENLSVMVASIEGAVSLEAWTHGMCRLEFHGELAGSGESSNDVLTTSSDVEIATDCQGGALGAASFIGHCVWPGTNPDTAEITFERPGVLTSVVDDM